MGESVTKHFTMESGYIVGQFSRGPESPDWGHFLMKLFAYVLCTYIPWIYGQLPIEGQNHGPYIRFAL